MILNTSLGYADVIKTIRELIHDLTPVGCFTITKQGFSFKIEDGKITLSDDSNPTGNFEEFLLGSPQPVFTKAVYDARIAADQAEAARKEAIINGTIPLPPPTPPNQVIYEQFSDLLTALLDSSKGYDVTLLPDYATTEKTYTLRPVSIINIDKGLKVFRRNYFSEETISRLILDYLIQYSCSCSMPLLKYFTSYCRGDVVVDTELAGGCYEVMQKLSLWVAYWLIDKRRMQLNSVNFLMSAQNGEICQDDFVNTNRNTTTAIGDTFKIQENQVSDGRGAQDFTALWGDADQYLGKFQLYIRNILEKRYNFYGLRDNIVISSEFCLDKKWEPYSYVDTIRLQPFTKDILSIDSNL